MKLFVGLGNPGRDYAKHRHNVGFMAVDKIADHHSFGPWKDRFQGDTCDGRLDGERVLVLKPQTYMNESGRSVAAAARYLKILPEDVVVFYDEIDLAPGKLKVKVGGGNAGHNGLRSITQHFGNDYQRVRIGVGHPGDKSQVANYVLSNFAKVDLVWLEPMLDEIAKTAPLLASNQSDRFLSDVVRVLQPEKPKKQSASATKSTSEQANPSPVQSPSQSVASKPSSDASSSTPSPLAEGLKSWFRKGGKDDTS